MIFTTQMMHASPFAFCCLKRASYLSISSISSARKVTTVDWRTSFLGSVWHRKIDITRSVPMVKFLLVPRPRLYSYELTKRSLVPSPTNGLLFATPFRAAKRNSFIHDWSLFRVCDFLCVDFKKMSATTLAFFNGIKTEANAINPEK